MTPRARLGPLVRLVLGLAALLTPRDERRAWRRQWEADLAFHATRLDRLGASGMNRIALVGHSLGAFPHGWWLRSRRWRRGAMMADFRDARRSIVRRPAFTAMAVLVLGLGLGANATVFSWLDAVVLHPIPGVPDASSLVVVRARTPARGDLSLSYPEFADIRAGRPPGLADLAAHRLEAMTMQIGGEPEQVWGEIVTGTYFDVLRVPPAIGRTFLPEEDRTPGTHPVLVVSHALWRTRLGADPNVVGRTLVVNGRPFEVIGVADEGFRGAVPGLALDVWVPMMMQQVVVRGDRLSESSRGSGWLTGIGRLAADASFEGVAADLDRVGRRISEAHGHTPGRTVDVRRLRNSTLGAIGLLGPALLVTMGAVAIVLLVVCANLAGLLVARAIARGREMSIRLALGATRRRVIRLWMVESLLLATLGGAAAMVLAVWTSGLLPFFIPPMSLPVAIAPEVSTRLVGFTLALTLLTAMLIALLPALQGLRAAGIPLLREGWHISPGSSRVRQGLVILQVALSLVLVTTAALFARSLENAGRVDLGFSTRQALLGAVDLQRAGYDMPRGRQFYRDLLQQIRAVPGVESVTLANDLPVCGCGGSQTSVTIDGYEPRAGEEMVVGFNRVAPGYFETLGTPIVRGRALTDRDTPETPLAAVINEAMARRYWGGRDPIGGRIRIGDRAVQVVGVTTTGKYDTLGEAPQPMMFFSLFQFYDSDAAVIVRTAGTPAAFAAAVRQVARHVDPNVPVFNVRTLDEHLATARFLPRMAASLLGALAGLALLLTVIGVYGVVALFVVQRQREIGVRVALGAAPGDVVRALTIRGLAIAGAGIAIGSAGSIVVARLIDSQLIGVSGRDLQAHGLGAGLLAVCVCAASWWPARRAARVNPADALRAE